MRKVLVLTLLALVAVSCVSKKRLTYLQLSEENADSTVYQLQRNKYNVQPNDILNINVRSFDAETSALFNSSQDRVTNMNAGDLVFYLTGYTVDLNGDIYVGGHTTSPNFAGKYTEQSVNAGGTDGFVAKLNTNGDLVWVRNINKTEVTQQDGAYASYSSFTKDNNTYFFISTAAENPQQISNQRIMFKQGYSRNRNVFLIKLDAKGDMSYEKIIDAKEARLPLMVSKPLIINDDILFYAKRGSKKQLVKVGF